MNCISCGQHLSADANYCSNCGEHQNYRKITVKNMLRELAEDGLGWDNRFFNTFRATLVAPKQLADDYLNGKRNPYLKPFLYLTIALAISILVYSIFEEGIYRKFHEMYDSLGANNLFMTDEKLDKMLSFSTKYQNFISFLYIPIYSLASYVVYRKRYNYAEHLVLNTFIYSTTSILSTTILFLLIIADLNSVFIQLMVVFQTFIMCYFFNRIWRDNFWKSIVRSIAYIFFNFFLIYGVIGILTNVIIIYLM